MFRKIIRNASIGAYRMTMFGLPTGPHVTRYAMYGHLHEYFEPRPSSHRVLSISRSEKLAFLLGYENQQITEASYPEFNVLNLPFEDGEFDAVVSDQVLEHVQGSPYAAMDELFRVLKYDGIALHSTCFINPIHGCPNDYWRFTPAGLQEVTRRHGSVIDVGGWGNPMVWPFVWAGLRYQPIPHTRWHPANWLASHNSEKWPIVTWILMKKGFNE